MTHEYVGQQTRRALALVAIVATAAVAQSHTGIAAVDSASAARAAWLRAASALERHDTIAARRDVMRAAESWPIQPSYLWANAVLSARAHDSAATLGALESYSALGLGRDLRAESSFVWLAGTPRFEIAVSTHDANSRPLARSRVRATLPDSTFWPEGMDFDPRTHRFYVGSVGHHTIAEVSADGSIRELISRNDREIGAILGVRVDTVRGVLWATTSGVPQAPGSRAGDTAIAALLRIRIADGAVERRWNLPPISGGHMLGDLAIGPNGDVFVTDSNEPVFYRLRPGGDTLESLRSPLFRSLQGIAPSPDGRLVYVADYSHGLLRVDLRSRIVTRLGDAPGSTSIGCDGLAWDRGAIVAVQNGVSPARVMRFVLDASGRNVVRADLIDRNSTIADEPTIGAVVGREFVYIANSQWEKYRDAGGRISSKPLTAPILLAAPLP